MGFFLTFFLFVGFTVIGELLRPKPKFGAPAPSGIGDFSLPTAQEGRAIPVAFGTVKMAGPNVVWFGDLSAVPIRQRVKTGLFSSKRIITGHRYLMGQQLVLCHGEIDSIEEVRWDDRPIAFTLAPTHHMPTTPDAGGWGIVGAPTASKCIDDPVNDKLVTDKDVTFIQGVMFLGFPALVGARWSLGSPKSASFIGWKLHIIARKFGGNDTVPDETVELFINTTYTGNPPVFSGGTTVLLLTNQLRDQLTTEYVDYVFNLTEAQASQINTGNNMSVLVTSQASTGDPGMAERITQFFLEVPGSLANEPVTLKFTADTAFGGTDREGGVSGLMDIYRGTQTQVANSYLTSLLGSLPAYRGISYAVMRRMYQGTTPYLKPLGFVIKRTPNGLGLTGGQHNINGDANPAAMLYEILTNDRWGLALAVALIDVESFRGAAAVLVSESFGLSMIFDGAASARDLLGEVLRHIDGLIFTDPRTGKLKLTLARGNYQAGDPILLSEDMIETVRISRPSLPDTKNHVKVSFVDRSNNYLERVAQAQDLANIQERGGEISEETFDYRGISNATVAQVIAARELKTVSYPIAVLEITANRRAWTLRPGDLFRLNWSPLGIVGMASRVTRVGTGKLRDGRIRIDAVEDVFGITHTGYVAPGASGWVDPIAAPVALGAQALVEVPYVLVPGPDRLVMTLGAQGAFPLLGYRSLVDSAGGTDYAFAAEVLELTPSGVLSQDLSYTTIEFTVSSGIGLSVLETADDADFASGQNVVLIGTELIAWQLVAQNADGTFTFSGGVRGVADTVPRPHSIGERVWFISEGAGLTSSAPYDADVLVAVKLVPFTSVAVADPAGVTSMSLQTNSRARRPYVPTNITINSVLYPTALQPYSDIAVAWSHRNRLGEWFYDVAGATGSPEAGTTYTLNFYGQDGLLKKSYTGLTGTSQTWTTEVADAGARQESVRITLEAIVAGLGSFQIYDFTIFRSIVDTVRSESQILRGARQRRPRGTKITRTGE